MIERAVVTYLREYLTADPTYGTVIGSKVYWRRPPPDTKLPWIRITNSGGGIERLSCSPLGSSEARDILTIYVDDNYQMRGEEIARLVERALRNYRGNMPRVNPIAFDTLFDVDTTRDLDGFQDAFTYLVTVHVRYKFPTAFPN